MTVISRPLSFLTICNGKQLGQNLFFTEKVAFFFKTLCFQQILVLKKWKYYFNSNCQKTVWTLINFPSRFVALDKVRKGRPKFFLYWKGCLFLKKLCFQQTIKCYRNDFINSTVIVKLPCGPIKIVRRGLAHSIMPEKNGQKIFFTWNVAFFLFKRLCFQQPLRS